MQQKVRGRSQVRVKTNTFSLKQPRGLTRLTPLLPPALCVAVSVSSAVPCYHPLQAGRSKNVDLTTGKHRIVFGGVKFHNLYEPIQLPCGRCRGCRHEHARQWAVRCVHEASLYDANCFITVTYCDGPSPTHPKCTHEILPVEHRSNLIKADFQNFMKRLRKHFYGNQKSDVRYFHCGEYGENFGRPHHHACLFNFDFPDKKVWSNKSGNTLYRSDVLESLWPYGYSTIGAVNYSSAAYVARYVIKKINGKLAPDHYQGRQPEYTTMSRRPGIAREWYEKYKDTDVFPRDFIVLNGVKQKVPKYYNKCYELTNPDDYGSIKSKRIEKAKSNPNNNLERLKAAEQIQLAFDQKLVRNYEKDNY